jgi:hypothetical protein
MNQRRVSARYYLFEEVLEATPAFAQLRKRASLSALQMHAALVWQAEKGRGACPAVLRRRADDYSHYEVVPGSGKPGVIHLARKHQNLGGLLHELAHALGPNDKLTHGPTFRRRCLRLYKLYGGWSGEVG